jgi:hypothetical protein
LDDVQSENDEPSPAPTFTKTKRKRKAAVVSEDEFEPLSPAPTAKNTKRKRKAADISQDEFEPPSPAPTAKKIKRKRADIDKASEDFPKPCPDSAICGVTKDFANENLMRNHRALHHDPNWPEGGTPCDFPGCLLPRDHLFISREQYRRHLSGRHMLNAEQARVYIGNIIPLT